MRSMYYSKTEFEFNFTPQFRVFVFFSQLILIRDSDESSQTRFIKT